MVYFFHMGAVGLLVPYFPVYLKYLQFSKVDIGWLISIFAISYIGLPIMWGRVSDKIGGKPTTLSAGLMLLSGLAFLGLFFGDSFWIILLVLSLSMFFRVGMMPLLETSCNHFCSSHHYVYGRIRVWGTIGFFVSVLLGGIYFSKNPIGHLRQALVGMSLLATVLLMLLKHRDVIYQDSHSREVDLHLKWNFPKMFGYLLAACFLMQMSHGAYYGFFSLYLKSLGLGEQWVGYLWVPSLLAEMIVMLWWAPKLKLRSPVNIIIFALGMACLRWLIIANTTKVSVLLASQLLHAFTYGCFHLAMMEYIRRNIKTSNAATAQACYTSFTYGLGNTVGYILQGYIGDHSTYRMMFLISTLMAGLGFSLLAWAQQNILKHQEL